MLRVNVQFLLEKMNEKHMSIDSFCQAINISRQTYYNWLADPQKFLNRINQITEVLQVQVMDILVEDLFPKKMHDFDY